MMKVMRLDLLTGDDNFGSLEKEYGGSLGNHLEVKEKIEK